MGFRNPITTADAVDTRTTPAAAGVRMYEAPNPDTGLPVGIVEFDDGFPGDTPAQLMQTAVPSPRGLTISFGRLAIKGGAYAIPGGGTMTAPELDLSIDQDAAGNPIPAAKITGASKMTLPAATFIGSAQAAAVGGAWTYDVQNGSYLFTVPTTAFTALPQHSLSVVIPAGQVLDVEWYTPRAYVTGGSWVAVQLLLGGAVADAAEFSAGSVGTIPMRLAGSIAGGSSGATVAVVVQAKAGGTAYLGPGAGAIGASGAGGFMTLRHRNR